MAVKQIGISEEVPWANAACTLCENAIAIGESCWLLFGDWYICANCVKEHANE